jgi:hypothetical protein
LFLLFCPANQLDAKYHAGESSSIGVSVYTKSFEIETFIWNLKKKLWNVTSNGFLSLNENYY